MSIVGVPSNKSIRDYSPYFPDCGEKFRTFPTWCGFPEVIPANTGAPVPVFSDGRSVRDYKTLLETLKIMEVPAILVTNCDSIASLSLPENVDVYFDVLNIRFAELMARAFVVVVPLNPANFDAGQSVVLQAMCYGKPIVSTDTAGISEYIENGISGLLVPPGEPQAMAAAIRSLLDNPGLAFSMGEKARKKYWEQYSRDAFVRRLASVFC